MLGGFGSINHMIVTLRNNKNLLPAKRSYFKKKDYGSLKSEYYKAVGGSFNIKKASAEELLAIRKKIIKKREKETRRFIFLLGISIPLIVLGLYFTFHNFRFGFPNVKTTQEISLENDDEEKYYFYLEDGDKWLQKRNYYNAVFQYKKAVALYPSDFEANYRLALGYSYQCQYDFENCDKGMQLILKLEKEFPDNKDIQNVKAIFVHWGA
ncbi:MAG: tetratricopeptide repeat protein [Aequorivita sp.]|nr:tetratricopeptide repeat protein [Aequorivita sp.]